MREERGEREREEGEEGERKRREEEEEKEEEVGERRGKLPIEGFLTPWHRFPFTCILSQAQISRLSSHHW